MTALARSVIAVGMAAALLACSGDDDNTVPAARTAFEPTFSQAEPGPIAPGDRFVLDFDGGQTSPSFVLLTADADGDWQAAYEMKSNLTGSPSFAPIGGSFGSTLALTEIEGPVTFVMPDDVAPGQVLMCDSDLDLNCLELTVGP